MALRGDTTGALVRQPEDVGGLAGSGARRSSEDGGGAAEEGLGSDVPPLSWLGGTAVGCGVGEAGAELMGCGPRSHMEW